MEIPKCCPTTEALARHHFVLTRTSTGPEIPDFSAPAWWMPDPELFSRSMVKRPDDNSLWKVEKMSLLCFLICNITYHANQYCYDFYGSLPSWCLCGLSMMEASSPLYPLQAWKPSNNEAKGCDLKSLTKDLFFHTTKRSWPLKVILTDICGL